MRIWLSRPHMSGDEQKYLQQAFENNFIAPIGPQLDEFESTVARYLGEGVHCVGVSSGTAALHLALRSLCIKEDDEVWVSSMTFAGGVFPVLYEKAQPVFFDVSQNSWTISAELIEENLKKASLSRRMPKAIIATDLYGQSIDLDLIEKIAEKYGVRVIVDSAESLGARYKNNRRCGTGGDASILSFNGNKIITTSSGGMLVSKSAEIIAQAKFLATQARDPAPHYQHSTYGYNYRMSNICAAIGLGQMEVLDERVDKRREIYERYHASLNQFGINFMPEPIGYYSSRWLTVVSVNPNRCGVTREDIRKELAVHKIETRPLWKPMHMQPLFKNCAYIGSGFDVKLFETGLCLPSGSDMTWGQQDEVIERIKEMLN